ncbi:phage terminase small subunit [Pseudomonas sp. AN-1]|uniref:phage terminase small subunit n=1 Tax=Pseudomonas sp. AN-1 TaxID=3096605 RepID=UPI002A6B1B77|nr:phage terminase small subunit [Pseudomonas sp. AN-1]WPP47718.1 phage terminase small subunit [Pseudomonas sp. AN-1]
MSSPCRRHFEQVTAAQAAATVDPGQTMEGATAYELQLAQLAQDRARLKQIQSAQGKAELKRQLLPAYQPYVDGVLAAGRGAQDEVLTTIMVWRIDAGDYAGALEIAAYVLQHNLIMPDRFARTTGCLIAEEVAEAALKALKAGETFDVEIISRAGSLTKDQDMPDEARAKLHLAYGRAVMVGLDEQDPDAADLMRAAINLRRAIDLHSNCGAKKDLERAERLLKKHAPADAAPAQEGQGEQQAQG